MIIKPNLIYQSQKEISELRLSGYNTTVNTKIKQCGCKMLPLGGADLFQIKFVQLTAKTNDFVL
jgi:hypothetical protein